MCACVRASVISVPCVCVCVCAMRAHMHFVFMCLCARASVRAYLFALLFQMGFRCVLQSGALQSRAVTQGRLFILKSDYPDQGRSCLPYLLIRRSLRGTLPPRSHQGETPLTQPQTKVSTTVFLSEEGLDKNNCLKWVGKIQDSCAATMRRWQSVQNHNLTYCRIELC